MVSKLERPVSLPEVLHPLGRPVLQAQVLVEPGHGRDGCRRLAAFEPCGHAVVGQLGLVADTRPVESGALDGTVRADHHFDDHRQPVLVETQRGDVGGKPLGQHREDDGRRIDRGRVVAGVLVDGRALGDDRVHVRDGDEDLHPLAGQGLGHGKLVQVAGVVVVDGSPKELPEIANLAVAGCRRA